MDGSPQKSKTAFAVVLIALLALIGVGLFTVYARPDTQQSAAAPKPVMKQVSAKAELQAYDNDVLYFESTDGTLRGTAGITYLSKDLDVIYNFYSHETLDGQFTYVADFKYADAKTNPDPSMLSQSYFYKDQFSDPFTVRYEDLYKLRPSGAPVGYFFSSMRDTLSYDDLLMPFTVDLYRKPRSAPVGLGQEMLSGTEKVASYSFTVKPAPKDMTFSPTAGP